MRQDHAAREKQADARAARGPATAQPRGRSRQVHPALLLAGAGAYAWILGVLAVVLGTSPEALFVIGISAIFLLVYLTVPGFMALVGHAESQRTSLRAFLDRPMELWTGEVPGREAALQVVLLPVALAVGMTAIGVVILVTRAGIGG